MTSYRQKVVEAPVWYVEPVECRLPVIQIVDGPWPDEEVTVCIESRGEPISAFVPTWAIDRERETVACMVTGESRDGLWAMAVIPPASLGATTALILPEQIREFEVAISA